jgi:hypothetical protein
MRILFTPDGTEGGGNSPAGTAAEIVVKGKTEEEILAEKEKQEKDGEQPPAPAAPAAEPEKSGVLEIMGKFWGL